MRKRHPGRKPNPRSPYLQLELGPTLKADLVAESAQVGETPAHYVAAILEQLTSDERIDLYLQWKVEP